MTQIKVTMTMFTFRNVYMILFSIYEFVTHLLLKISNFSHDSSCVLNGLNQLSAVLNKTYVKMIKIIHIRCNSYIQNQFK